MKRTLVSFLLIFVISLTALPGALFGGEGPVAETDGETAGWGSIEGYAGPGWSVLFDLEGGAEMASLTPVMFRLSDSVYFGPIVSYEES